jgi:DNA-binding LytR/AlgR family response regulator
MRYVIIEDEPFTAEDLASDLRVLRPHWVLAASLSSVAQATAWFQQGIRHDLVFSDIQLGDGTCFEVFERHVPQAPVVFCTAYDQFAVEAFQHNGIGYVLKPFSIESLRAAVEKFERLRPEPISQATLDSLLAAAPAKSSRILVHHRDKIIPVALADAAIFYLHHELVMVKCMDGSTYPVSQALGEIEALAGAKFFRASRQHLVNRDAIKAATQHVSRKLLLELRVGFDEQVTVSKEKMSVFLDWLAKGS